jgi:hypothetical protein
VFCSNFIGENILNRSSQGEQDQGCSLERSHCANFSQRAPNPNLLKTRIPKYSECNKENFDINIGNPLRTVIQATQESERPSNRMEFFDTCIPKKKTFGNPLLGHHTSKDKKPTSKRLAKPKALMTPLNYFSKKFVNLQNSTF